MAKYVTVVFREDGDFGCPCCDLVRPRGATFRADVIAQTAVVNHMVRVHADRFNPPPKSAKPRKSFRFDWTTFFTWCGAVGIVAIALVCVGIVAAAVCLALS